jgi:hypothetical protein
VLLSSDDLGEVVREVLSCDDWREAARALLRGDDSEAGVIYGFGMKNAYLLVSKEFKHWDEMEVTESSAGNCQ